MITINKATKKKKEGTRTMVLEKVEKNRLYFRDDKGTFEMPVDSTKGYEKGKEYDIFKTDK